MNYASFESYLDSMRESLNDLGSSQLSSLERRINGVLTIKGSVSEAEAQQIVREVRDEIYGIAREMGALFHAGCNDCGCKC
jgi:hypothetical protein